MDHNSFDDLVASGGLAEAEYFARVGEERARKFRLGQKYAEQENGALAGMAEMPDVPPDCENDPDFEAGYWAWLDSGEGTP